MTLSDKKIVIGVTGGIAAYKVCELVSLLRREGAEVKVIMTEHATRFVSPLTFEVLSHNPVVTDMFARDRQWEVEHIALAEWADLFVVAPATANIIGKVATGIADDMLSTTIMATKAHVMVVPAMNTNMYLNDVVQSNISRLIDLGMTVMTPSKGMLACGVEGVGRLPEPIRIYESIKAHFGANDDFSGRTVLVTAGATREPIDPVRYVTNHSSGRMGVEIAKAFIRRGARVILVAGSMTVQPPKGAELVRVETTLDMYDAVMTRYAEADVIVKAAAPADYRVEDKSGSKLKSESLTLSFTKNPDIARAVGEVKGDRKLVVFSAETDDLIANARGKLVSKHADMVVANDVTVEGAGFNVDTNIVTIITADGRVVESGLRSKAEIADLILDNLK